MPSATQVGLGKIFTQEEKAKMEARFISRQTKIPTPPPLVCKRNFPSAKECDDTEGRPYLAQGIRCALCGRIGIA
jgi:hypothetical protein